MHAVWRHLFIASLWRRPFASALTLLAIALGVALGLAVQLIHQAALDEFGRGLRLLGGEADLQIVGAQSGFPDTLYPLLAQRPEIAVASPVLDLEARLPGREETLRILGLDLFQIAAITPGLLPSQGSDEGFGDRRAESGAASEGGDRLAALRPDALFLSPEAARRLDLNTGDRLRVQVGLREVELRILGSVPGAAPGQALATMDIAAAQQVFDRIGQLSRIDLRLASGVDRARAQRDLAAILPPGVTALTPAAAESETLGLSRAYRVNLTMLAAIALITGGFLVFSAQWLSVVRRRQEFALLRALGLDRRHLEQALRAEGAVLGLGGGLIGILLAYGLTALALRWVGGDLGAGFFAGLDPRLRLEPGLTLLYLGFGILAGIAGAWWPAREAARLDPARGLRAGDEAEVYRARPRWGATWTLLGLAALLCLLPPIDEVPVFGYAAVALLLAGAVLALPGAMPWAMRRLGTGRSVTWRLARARLAAAPGQAAVAGAGVVASVALAVAMTIMVASFRDSLDEWLIAMLPADIYLRASASTASGALDPAAVARVAALPGVVGLRAVRYETLRLTDRAGAHAPITLISRPVDRTHGLPLVRGAIPAPPGANAPPAWISEALADRLRLGVGDPLILPLGGAVHPFQVAGIWRDYARQRGAVVIEAATFQALTGDASTHDLGLFLAPGEDPLAVMAALRETLGARVSEMILPGELRAMILEIFDRTFLVTYLMQAVAIMIGLFGIGTTFAALAASRRREFGILRHLGLLRRQIGALLAREAALIAGVGVAIGLAAGGAIALVLIEVINRQSFHWSMDLKLPWPTLSALALTLVVLAALAARLAGHRAMRQDAVLAVREDW